MAALQFASSPVLGGARSANVAKFRAAYDDKHALQSTAPGGYSAVRHFATLNAMAGFVMLYCAWRIISAPEPHWLAGGLVSTLSFLVANLGEYALHRFDMHHPDSKSDHSPVHHRYFTAGSMFLKSFQDCHTILFRVSFIFKALFFVLPCLGAVLNALLFPTCGYFFLLVTSSYYLQYEWLHLSYHAPADSLLGSLPGMALLRRHHRIHHHQPFMRQWNFNITYPFMDLLFGTYYRGPLVYDPALDHVAPPPLSSFGQPSHSTGVAATAGADAATVDSGGVPCVHDDDEDGVLVESAEVLQRKQAASPRILPSAISATHK